MKYLLATLALSWSLTAAAPAAELLLNGNFESPVQTTNGDHINTVPTNWTTATTAAPTVQATNTANLVRGTVTNGTGTTAAQALAPSPYDTSGSSQSLDGNGATIVAFQNFTPSTTLNSRLEIKISFGGRDATSNSANTAGSSWQLINTATSAVLASASGFKPAPGAWVLSDVVTGQLTLTAGTTYKFQVTLDDPAHLDTASITNVPEPTTLAAVATGLLALGLATRRSKSR